MTFTAFLFTLLIQDMQRKIKFDPYKEPDRLHIATHYNDTRAALSNDAVVWPIHGGAVR